MDPTAILALLSGITSLIGKFSELTKKSKDRKLNDVILEFQQKILEVQQVLYNLQAENEQLKRQIAEFENETNLEDSVTRIEGKVYGKYTDKNGNKFTICMKCWDDEKKIVQLDLYDNNNYFHCPKCNYRGKYND